MELKKHSLGHFLWAIWQAVDQEPGIVEGDWEQTLYALERRHLNVDTKHPCARNGGMITHVMYMIREQRRQIPDALALMAHAHMAYDYYCKTFESFKPED